MCFEKETRENKLVRQMGTSRQTCHFQEHEKKECLAYYTQKKKQSFRSISNDGTPQYESKCEFCEREKMKWLGIVSAF